MAKFLDSAGVTNLTKIYDERYAPASHPDVVATAGILGHIISGAHYTVAATYTKPSADKTTAPSVNTAGTTAGRYYPIETDVNGFAFVNVPWSNTTYSAATTGALGLIKPWKRHTAASTYNSGTAAPTDGTTAVNVNAVTTTAGRYFAVEMDTNGRAFVNVPYPNATTSLAWSAITSKPNFATVATSGAYSDLSGTPTLATVATSGSYNDLSNKPTIPTIPANNVTGSGTANCLAKWDGANSLVAGPAFGASSTTYLKNDGTWGTPPNTTYSAASRTALGLIKACKKYTVACTYTMPSADTTTAVTINAASTTTGKYYPIEVDKDGLAFVNVPWTDNNTTYSNGAGLSLTGTTFSVVVPTTSAIGGIKPWKKHTAASKYNTGTTAPPDDATAVNVNAVTTTTGRYYAIEMDSDGRAFVNVPWTDNNTTYEALTDAEIQAAVAAAVAGN